MSQFEYHVFVCTHGPYSKKDVTRYPDEVHAFKDVDAQIDEQRATARLAILTKLRQPVPASD